MSEVVWFNVDDNLCFHPKALQAGNASMGVWVRAGSWCQLNLTNGHVPAAVAKSIGSAAEIERLMRSGLWLPASGGYEFHQFLDRNRSKDKVAGDRAALKKRQQKWRERQTQVDEEEAAV